MKNTFKSVLITFMLVATVLFVTACSNKGTPYDVNNEKGFNVSVRYDANGGMFTTNTDVIVDSYNISGMSTNAEGKVELALLAPDDAARGSTDKYTATKAGHFLVGWYTERTENGTDSNGNVIYTYSGRWDFQNGLYEVNPNGTYSADEPVVTLYAAWAPLYEIHFYDKVSGELLGTETFNPLVDQIETPQWGKKTGAMEMNDFPKAPKGYTFQAAYYEDGSVVDTEFLKLPETLNLENGTAGNRVMKVELEWMEGDWYRIYTAEQLYKSADADGNYVICADLDFDGEKWPAEFAFGTFNGSITTLDNSVFTIRNVAVKQTKKDAANGGLFGVIGETAVIENITFENVSFELLSSVDKGTPAYGLFAGKVQAGATINNVTLASGQIIINSDCRMSEQGSVGLVCGNGSTAGITYVLENLTAVAGGSKPESVDVQTNGEWVSFVITK